MAVLPSFGQRNAFAKWRDPPSYLFINRYQRRGTDVSGGVVGVGLQLVRTVGGAPGVPTEHRRGGRAGDEESAVNVEVHLRHADVVGRRHVDFHRTRDGRAV